MTGGGGGGGGLAATTEGRRVWQCLELYILYNFSIELHNNIMYTRLTSDRAFMPL